MTRGGSLNCSLERLPEPDFRDCRIDVVAKRQDNQDAEIGRSRKMISQRYST
jgi:hypothetical protein